MGSQELPEVGDRDRVEVAVGDEYVIHLPDGLLCELYRVPGAELLGLLDEYGRGLQPPGLDGIADVVGPVADDDHDPRRLGRAHHLEGVPQEWASADRMEDLRDTRLQTLALARGEHHGGERSGGAFGGCAHVGPSRLVVSRGQREDRSHGPIRPRHVEPRGSCVCRRVPGGGKSKLTTHPDPHVKVPVQTRSELDKLRIVCRELRGLPAAYQRLPGLLGAAQPVTTCAVRPHRGPCLRAQDAATVRRSEQGRQLKLRTGGSRSSACCSHPWRAIPGPTGGRCAGRGGRVGGRSTRRG